MKTPRGKSVPEHLCHPMHVCLRMLNLSENSHTESHVEPALLHMWYNIRCSSAGNENRPHFLSGQSVSRPRFEPPTIRMCQNRYHLNQPGRSHLSRRNPLMSLICDFRKLYVIQHLDSIQQTTHPHLLSQYTQHGGSAGGAKTDVRNSHSITNMKYRFITKLLKVILRVILQCC
jgi:hypothetical protein